MPLIYHLITNREGLVVEAFPKKDDAERFIIGKPHLKITTFDYADIHALQKQKDEPFENDSSLDDFPF